MITKKELLLKKTIELKGKEYNIVDSYETNNIERFYESVIYKTSETKIKEFFSWIPVYANGKFKWFKKVKAKYIFYIIITNNFDEWNYSHYWAEPKGKWKIEEILN